MTVGHHAGYDRVVFTFHDHTLHFEVGYVSRVAHEETGAPVRLRGSAFLALMLRGTEMGLSVDPTITPGFPMLKQIKKVDDFEGDVSYGIGAASSSGFRAFTLTGPNRLVIDLAIPATASGSTGSSGPATGSGATGSGATGSGATGSGTAGTSGTATGSQAAGSQATGSEATGSGGTGSGTTGARQTGSGGSGGLASTGPAKIVPLVLGGLVLVGLGGAGLWLARRRYAA